MAETRSLALVLHVREYREADKLVTLITRNDGKVTVVARGVRKIKSRFSALVEPLTLGNFLLHRGRSLDTLIQGEIIKPYVKLKTALPLLANAQYFCELCEASLPDREPAAAVFDLLLTALETLESDGNPGRVACCFELNLLDLLGYRPALEQCGNCGGITGPYFFNPSQGGLICALCSRSAESFPVSGGAVAVMKHFLNYGFFRLSVCSVPDSLQEEIRRVGKAMFFRILGKSCFKTLEFLENLDSC